MPARCRPFPWPPVLLLAVAAALPAAAQPSDCAFDAGADAFACQVFEGDSTFRVLASDESLLADLLSDRGTPHLGLQAFGLFDLDGGFSPDVLLEQAPTADAATKAIETVYVEDAAQSRFRATVQFEFAETAGGVRVDEVLTLESLQLEASLAFRIYAYTDFDLLGDAFDDGAALTAPGTLAQADGSTLGIVQARSGPAPTAFQVGLSPDVLGPFLEALDDGVLFTPDGSGSGLGPGDLEHVLSWDVELGPGQSVAIGLRKTIVPEPATALLLVAGLAGLATRRRAPSPRGTGRNLG